MRLIAYLVLLLLLLVCDWANDAHFGHSIFSESESTQPACHPSTGHGTHGSSTIGASHMLKAYLPFPRLNPPRTRFSSRCLGPCFPAMSGRDLCYCVMSMQRYRARFPAQLPRGASTALNRIGTDLYPGSRHPRPGVGFNVPA